MGFSKEDAQQALEGARGNLELAVEDLINRKPHSEVDATMLETLDEKLRGLPSNVMERLQVLRVNLQETVSNVKQHQTQLQNRVANGECENFQRLQATLEQTKARLGEVKEVIQAGMKKARGSQPDAQEEETLRKAEAQLVDAQIFVAETLASLRAHGSEVITGATAKYSSELNPENKDGNSVIRDTMDAAASAAVDEAKVAVASMDDFLTADSSTGSAGHSAFEENASMPKPDVKNATKMDHAQVLLSRSMGGLRSLAAGLSRSDRTDPWLTVPAADDATVAATSDAGIAAAASSAASHNAAVAEVMSVPQAKNIQAVHVDTSDEFLCVSGDEAEAPAVACHITGVVKAN